MSISRVHDPFLIGATEGAEMIQIRRKDWDLTQQIIKLKASIPRNEINPLTNSDYAWKVMDKIVSLWQSVFPDEAKVFFSSVSRAPLAEGHGFVKDKNIKMRQLASIPTRLVSLTKAVFPGQDFGGETGKKVLYKFAQRYPFVRDTEKI